LAGIRIAQGHLDQAFRVYQRALQLAAREGEPLPPGTVDLYRGLGELYRERGDLEAAERALLRGEELGAQTATTDWQHRLCVTQARLKVSQGDLEGALDLLDEAERLHIRNPLPDVRPLAALRARIWIAQGKLSQAQNWARERRLSTDDDLGYLREFEHITLARMLIARFKSDRIGRSIHEAMRLLERLLDAAQEGGRTGSAIEILALQALAHAAQGDTRPALASLDRALVLAEPEGYLQVFVDEGPPMAALLREAAQQEIAPDMVRRLRAAFGDAASREATSQPLVEPLSERERDVLRLLKTDLSGPEIARELVVSLNTVRTHTRHIYGKLGVNNRRAAVRRAEELDL
jgi:LuxR family maltose regulon positive regulatory protein